MRIGIDVGGTHTDAVLMDGMEILCAHKALTSNDVRQGIIDALDRVMTEGRVDLNAIKAVMIGTTHFTNAIIERRQLSPTAIIRACLPTGSGLPPMCDWPSDIASVLGYHGYMIGGGHLFDGRQISSIDETALDQAITDIIYNGVKSIAVSAAFSPANNLHELKIAAQIRRRIPDANISMSHEIGRLGILERENAALLNASLSELAAKVVSSMEAALTERGLHCPFFVSQNDGTLMSAKFIARYPALTFSSGPTNSLRGAAVLSGMKDALVVDIGGTTLDVGVLSNGFPRESNSHIAVGGVRTNFRMPDILPIGLGGGSLVTDEGARVGPQSVGHKLVSEAIVFGGSTLTATDIAVANGSVKVGNTSLVQTLDPALVERSTKRIHDIIDEAIDKMRPSETPVPVILVGGGAILVSRELDTASSVIVPDHAGVANAVGAAIAQVGGEVEQIVSFSKQDRAHALEDLTQQAQAKAIAAGADPKSLRLLDIEETSVSYMDDEAVRIRIKVVGELRHTK